MELRELIRRMARENVLWGEERIANELLLKLGIRISPRTVRKYLPKRPPGRPRGDLRWSTFLKSHARAILACDFFVAVTATFGMLYGFVVIEHGTRRLAHVALTVLEPQGERNLRAGHRHDPARVSGLDDSAVRGASPLDPVRVGCSRQRRASAQRAGTRRSRPSRRICTRPESRIPTSMDAGALVRAKSVLGGLHHEYSV